MSFLIIKSIIMATKAGKFIRRLALGVKDVLLPNLKANLEAPEGGWKQTEGGEGKFDYWRLGTSIALILLIAGFLFGKVTMEQIQIFMEFLK